MSMLLDVLRVQSASSQYMLCIQQGLEKRRRQALLCDEAEMFMSFRFPYIHI